MNDEYNFKEHYKLYETIYYLRVLPSVGINEVVECKIRTLESDYLVASVSNNNRAIYVNIGSKDFVFKDKRYALKESKKYNVRKVTTDNTTDD